MFRNALLMATIAFASASEPEWAGGFALADGTHKWIMQKVGGAYADPKMWLVMMPTSDPSRENVDALQPAAMALVGEESGGHDHDDGHDHGRRLSAGCKTVKSGGTLAPPSGGQCYMLVVDESSSDSEWTVKTGGMSGIAMYAQHVPTEFERDKHFFKDSKGEDIEPIEYTKRWGEAIGASIIVNVVTLIGVILMIPAVNTFYKANPIAFTVGANAAAAGALLSCAFYLMLFEGSHYVAVGKKEEAEVAFLWGTMVLVGIITASVLELIVTAIMPAEKPATETASKDVEGGAAGDIAKADPTKRMRVLCGVLIGDFMHNLCDGVFIGTAFVACSNSIAWNITVATVAHELAQEIADFIVLTDPAQGGLKPVMALGLNFLSGLSVLLGTVIIMSLDKIDDNAIGMILTFGGGVYLQIGCVECMGMVGKYGTSSKLKLMAITLFCLGAVAIGLVLLDHKHCSAGGGDGHDHGGGGHDHGRRLLGF